MLERCIDSIIQLNPAEGRYEIIIIDDGSDTPPVWLNSRYNAENIKFIQAEHRGPGAARNRGIYEACGKYIQFVDADDFLLQGNAIHRCIDMLKKENPQILRFHYRYDTDTDIQTDKEPTFGNTISGAVYMKENNLSGSPCTYFFRRELVIKKDIRFPEKIYHEDEEFNTILHYHAQTLIDSDAVLYEYCRREGSTTTNNTAEFEEKRIDDLFRIIKRLSVFEKSQNSENNNIQKKAIERKLDMLCVDAILNMLYTGHTASGTHDQCRKQLSGIGLYPLRPGNHSIKYRMFRLLANSKNGLKILRAITPKKKPLKR